MIIEIPFFRQQTDKLKRDRVLCDAGAFLFAISVCRPFYPCIYRVLCVLILFLESREPHIELCLSEIRSDLYRRCRSRDFLHRIRCVLNRLIDFRLSLDRCLCCCFLLHLRSPFCFICRFKIIFI